MRGSEKEKWGACMIARKIVLLAAAIAATASINVAPTIAANANGASHPFEGCIMTGGAVPVGSAASAQPKITCFGSLTSYAYARTGERLTFTAGTEESPPDLLKALARIDQMVVDAQPSSVGSRTAALAGVTVARAWKDTGFKSAYLDFVAPSGCGTGWNWNSIVSPWDNQISAWQTITASGCQRSQLYEIISYSGAMVTCTPDCAYVGDALNDRVRSVKVLP